MQLCPFGFHAQTQTNGSYETCLIPAPVVPVKAVKVLWSSWCDAIVASQDTAGSWTLEHMGQSLTTAQKDHILRSEDLRSAVSGGTPTVSFFGTPMHIGLQGYIISHSDSPETTPQVVIFATDLEISDNASEIEYYTLSPANILGIKIVNGGDILLSMTDQVTGEAQVLQFRDLAELRCCLRSKISLYSKQPPLASFVPVQWTTNATTSTALDQHGKAYTFTRDPRYPKSLGRLYEGFPGFETIPYLSETRVTKIASGGYMSAAVSCDGELFLWGQACPGTVGELAVLKADAVDDGEGVARKTGIRTEGEQDDFVKILTVRIDGEEARVYDVAIGYGHILVAVEVPDSKGRSKRALFAAGDNSLNQLGVGHEKQFLEEFEEVVAMRGKRIAQLVAVGWSSFVVTHN